MTDTTQTILIVDDIQDIREGISFMLTDVGYKVLEAENGIEATLILRENKVDLLITDILMPEMDGIELVKATKITHPNMLYILISGGGRQLTNKNDFNYLNLALKLTGVETVFKKPFKPEELINAVNKILEI